MNETPFAPATEFGNRPKNPLDDSKVESMPAGIYEEKDQQYLTYLQERLVNAKRQYDHPWPELNDKTPYQYYEENEKIANTKLPPKVNDDDVIVSSGTVESKLDALLSNINNLNIETEVHVFDRLNNRLRDLATSLQDTIHDTKIRDGADGAGDEEKKIQRQRTLLKQGTVYVMEEWLRKFETKKVLKQKYRGEFKDFAGYSEKLELVFEGPSRSVLHNNNVFLGDLTKFYMEEQPFVFVMVHDDYNTAKTKFGKFENWQYIKPGAIPETEATMPKTIYDNRWRLTELKKNQVEILYYFDPVLDEFNIIINGVLLMPIGFPLSAVAPFGKIPITKQVFRILSDTFALGGSFVASGSVKEISAIIDEMLRLFVLKGRKSFTPAYVNTSGRVIDRKALMPGRISMGIDPGALQPIASNETQGVTQGEVAVLRELQGLIDQNTVSDPFTGQQAKSGTTATEIREVTTQAKLTLQLAVFVCTLLEIKCDYLRLWNILANWFEPVDSRVVEVEGARKMVKMFRTTNRITTIEGEGEGERMIIPTEDEMPEPKVIRQMERDEQKKTGRPNRKIYLSVPDLKTAKLLWYITAIPKERENSLAYKLQFRDMLNDLMALVKLGSRPNISSLQEEFNRIHNKGRSKLFEEAAAQNIPGMGSLAGLSAGAGAPTRGPAGVSNQGGIPSMPLS